MRAAALSAVVVLLAAPAAFASRGPAFGLDENAWDATDIVVVSEATRSTAP